MDAGARNEFFTSRNRPRLRKNRISRSRTVSSRCSGCGSARIRRVFRIGSQPVVSNYRFSSAHRAAAVPRGDIELVRCASCGLVFNAAFDASLVPYDGAYENQQDFSAAFERHAKEVAGWMASKIRRRSPHILEIGCGKGVFLRRLVVATGGRGTGYDTSFEKTGRPSPNIRVRRQYLHPDGVDSLYDAIVVRHVVEHIGEIGTFLGELAEIARRAGSPPVFIETPRLEWIVRTGSAWDIFYEHCNYFTEPCLERLCRMSGFVVRARRRVFGGQYQLLELRLPRKTTHLAKKAAGKRVSVPLRDLRRLGPAAWREQARRIDCMRSGGPWILWGAGAKGVCLANRLPGTRPARVIDINPAKQGSFVPGAAVPVTAPSGRSLAGAKLVVIANPAYEREIKEVLHSFRYKGNLHVLSNHRS